MDVAKARSRREKCAEEKVKLREGSVHWGQRRRRAGPGGGEGPCLPYQGLSGAIEGLQGWRRCLLTSILNLPLHLGGGVRDKDFVGSKTLV